MSLTPNSIQTLFHMSGSNDNPSFNPIVQVLHCKKIDKAGGSDERYKLVLSDGQHFCNGMAATQLNHLIHSGIIAPNAILCIREFIINTMGSGLKICILLNVETASANPGNRIGAPVDITKVGTANGVGGASGMGAPPPQAQPMYGNINSGGYGVKNQLNGGGGGLYGNSGASHNPYGGGNPYSTNSTHSNSPISSSGPIVRTTPSGQPITPISGLNMYSNRWTIRAKITEKSDIRTWSNAKGEGSLFSITILDTSGVDVKCTFFKEAVDKFYGMLEEGRIYTFSGGRLKVANMQYNKCKSQFEITFDQNSEIHLDTSGEAGNIQEQYDFVKIANLENIEPNAIVDVLGVVKHVGEVATIMSKKSGKELTKCELLIEDDSGADVKLTVWGDTAQNAPVKFQNNPVVAFKRARVSDFGGRSLSGSGFAINPQIPEGHQLMNWWGLHGNKNQNTRSLSSAGGGSRGVDPFDSRKTVGAIKQEQLGYGEKPDWLTFKATITFLKREKQGDDGAWYTACANAGDPCKNMYKATQTSDGNYHCDKCQQTFPNCVRRFIFSGTVADDTSTSWVSVFNEQAETLFGGVTADELWRKCCEESSDRDLYDSTFLKTTYKEYIFKCKVKQEQVGDETRVKTSLTSVQPIDYVQESRDLLRALAV
mmetsp:Transcript_20556/g.41748  ORF Transcript_20556/g.41748 Transcript_20556/m.41748 type:complete len:654 (-) Transcript_20556:124-2085(-)